MRGLKLTGMILGALLGLYLVAYAFRYQTTLPIDGVIVDAKTGKPVSKVLVQAYWHFSRSNLVDTTGDEDVFGTVTDANGRFRIPRKNVTIVLGRFDDQYLLLRHPLYAFEEVQVFCPMKGGYQVGEILDRNVKLLVPFTSLSHKYTHFDDRFALASAIQAYGPEFYRTMTDQYSTRYDLRTIMGTLKELSERFPEPGRPLGNTQLAYRTLEFKMRELLVQD